MNIQKVIDEYEKKKEYDVNEALVKLKECLRLKNSPSTYQRIKILNLLGIISFRQSDHENAKKYLDEAESMATQYGDTLLLVRVRMSNCDLLKRQGKYLDAVKKNKEILHLLENIDTEEIRKVRTSICYGIATNLHHLGNLSEALEFGQKALTESAKLPSDIFQKGQPLEVLGLIFWSLGNNERAEYFFKQAVRHCRKNKLLRGLSINLGNLGGVIGDLHDDQTALEYLEESLEVTRQIEDPEGIIIGLSNLSFRCIRLKKFDTAKSYIEEAMTIAQNTGSDYGIANAKRQYGYYLISIGQTEEGIVAMKESLAMNVLHFWNKIWVMGILADTLENAGKFNEAIYYVREEKNLQIQEIEKKKAALEEYRVYLLNEEHEKEMRLQKRVVEINEQQLANSAIHLATQTEMLGNFRNEMRQIVREIGEPIAALKKIKEKLKELPCESVDWVKFEKEFTSVHPEFRAKLIEKYPELTKQEIKMCQLARLGLKTYEMSRLLCLSERTIDGHRNSLRKKLGLKPNESLKDFLQGIR
jgi:tetratricopeptide (TPR) repeat protein